MPQHDLDRTKVGSPLKQVRREGVPERMRVNLPFETSHFRIFLDLFPQSLSGESLAGAVEEKGGRGLFLQKTGLACSM